VAKREQEIIAITAGNLYTVKRISIKSLLHDVFIFLRILRKGLVIQLKQLIVAPGIMQREYVEGKRSGTRSLFPCSLFVYLLMPLRGILFLRYWQGYHQNTLQEANYFHDYSGIRCIYFTYAYITL
jgi:hypothetical protein